MTKRKDIIRLTPILAMLLTAVQFAACSSSENELSQEERVPVAFSLGFDVSVTRANIFDNIWPDNTNITISNGINTFGYTTSNTSSAAASGAAVSLTPTVTTDKTHQFYWPVSNPSWKFSAWYPAGDTPTLLRTVPANQSVKTGESGLTEDDFTGLDFLYMPPTAAIWRSTVELALKHQLARVIVTVNTTMTEKHETVTNIEFGGGRLGLTATGTQNEAGQISWAVSGDNKITHMRERTTDADRNVNRYVFECLLPPQSNSTTTDELIKIYTTGAIKEGTTDTPEPRYYTYKNAFDLQPGYQYTYNLIISEEGKVLMGSVELTAWDIRTGVDDTQTITR